MGASKQFWRPEANLNVPYRVFLKRFKYTEGLCIGIHIEFFLNYSIYIYMVSEGLSKFTSSQRGLRMPLVEPLRGSAFRSFRVFDPPDLF